MNDLLLEAAGHFANINNPAALAGREAALEEVRSFIAAEEKILALPGAFAELERLILEPLDPTGSIPNHAMMAGLILARSGWPAAVPALLGAARHPDAWCAVQARLNLSWLARGEEAASLLQDEIRRQERAESSDVPMIVLIEALIRQRAPATLPTIISYIEGGESQANRAEVLASLVNLWPEQGLQLAEDVGKGEPEVLSLTARGLRAVYLDREAYDGLLRFSSTRDDLEATVLRWVGRVPCPESLPVLLSGLNHNSSVVRCDVVTSLALLGSKEAYRAVAQALFDPAKEVADQAMALLFQSFGEALAGLTRQWAFGPDGRLDAASSRTLEQLVGNELNRLEPSSRYTGKTPSVPAHHLEDLYLGLLPDHNWYHWVSTTGSYQPYDIHKPLLYNFPSLEKLDDWYLTNQTGFSAGGFYYHGRPCGNPQRA